MREHAELMGEVKAAFRECIPKAVLEEVAESRKARKARDFVEDREDREDREDLDDDVSDALSREDPDDDVSDPAGYKANLKRLCLEYSATTDQGETRTVLAALWRGRDDHDAATLADVFRLVAVRRPAREVFEMLHARRAA